MILLVNVEGSTPYPIQVRYLKPKIRSVREAIIQTIHAEGVLVDILVFMPGEEDMAELSRELKMLRQANHLRFEFETHILHGGITQEDKEIRSPFTVKTMSALSLALSPVVITVMFIEAYTLGTDSSRTNSVTILSTQVYST